MFGLFKKKEKPEDKLNKKADNILTCIDELKVQLTKIESETDILEKEVEVLNQ